MSKEIGNLDGEKPVDNLDNRQNFFESSKGRGALVTGGIILGLFGLLYAAAGAFGGEDKEKAVELKGNARSSLESRVFDTSRDFSRNGDLLPEGSDTGENSSVRAPDEVGEIEVMFGSTNDESSEVGESGELIGSTNGYDNIPDIKTLLGKPAAPSLDASSRQLAEDDIEPSISVDKSQSKILVASNLVSTATVGGTRIDPTSSDPQEILRNLQEVQAAEEGRTSSQSNTTRNTRQDSQTQEINVVTSNNPGNTNNNNRTSTAARLAVRRTNPFVLSRGAYIDCVLQTQLNTQLAGLTKCQILHNVYSDNGDVLLVERGSTLTGEYQTVTRQGINRVLIRWVRVRTPNDVLIDLDSPATDPVGASGVPGILDNQFLKRFGGALLLSLIFDAKDAAFDNNRINLDSDTVERTNDTSEQIIEAILTLYADIQPTIEVDRGTRVGILVARDLDFSDVYELQAQ